MRSSRQPRSWRQEERARDFAPTPPAHLVAADHGQGDRFQHVYVIMMENTGTPEILGSPTLPYINHLIQTYGYDNNYFGVTHESLANYVAFLTGSNWGTHSDDPTQTFNHTNLVDQLEAHDLTWKGPHDRHR